MKSLLKKEIFNKNKNIFKMQPFIINNDLGSLGAAILKCDF